jgi:HK97 family phage portal protein
MSLRQALSKLVEEVRSPGMTSLELRGGGGGLNNPSVPLSAAGFLSWALGSEPTASGEQITVHTAMQQITVQACWRILSSAVASMQLNVLEVTDKGRKRVEDHSLSWLLRYEPNDEMSAFTLIEAMVVAMAATGNAYVEIQRDKVGRVAALWPLSPLLTEPRRMANDDLAYETTDGMTEGTSRWIAAADMLHVPLWSFNGLKGFSPIHLARQGIGLARASEKYGSRFFGNGARPGGILTRAGTLTPTQTKEMRETWNQTQGGDNQGSIAVLPGDWNYHAIGLSPEDSQFLVTRQFQRTEISQGLYGVPPHMVGDTNRLSNNNHEQSSLSFYVDTLDPYVRRIEAEFMRKLLPKMGRSAGRYVIKADVRQRLRGDFKTTMEGFAIGKQWGFFSTNDVLRELDMDLIGPEGDVYFAPVNMQNLERLLDTEPVQDQPIGADPNALDPVEAEPAEQKMMGKLTRAYWPVFSDSFTRLLKRDKRDYEAISALFRPVFRSIAEASCDSQGSPQTADEALVDDALRGLEKRAAKWQSADAGELAQAEFVKAIRSIHINVSRGIAAQRASQQLAPEGA